MKNVRSIILLSILAVTVPLSAQQEGDPAPDFEVDLLGGETFRLSEQEGKVVMIFLFGNTCPSCIAVGSTVESTIFQRFKEVEAFSAIGLDTWDNSSNESSVSTFRNTTGITFPLGLKAKEIAAQYSTTYDRLMVVDQEGILVHKGVLVAANDIENTVEAIEESLSVTGSVSLPDAPEFSLYPIPASEMVTVETGGHVIEGMSLFDTSGRKVLERRVPFHQASVPLRIPVDLLDEGIYILSLFTAEGIPMKGHLVIRR